MEKGLGLVARPLCLHNPPLLCSVPLEVVREPMRHKYQKAVVVLKVSISKGKQCHVPVFGGKKLFHSGIVAED